MEGHRKPSENPKKVESELKTPRKMKTKRKLFEGDESTPGTKDIMSPSYAFPTTPRGQEAVESYFMRKRALTPKHIDRYVEFREHMEDYHRKLEIFGDRDDVSVDDSDVDPTYRPQGRRSSLSDPAILGTGDDLDEEFSGFSEESGEEGRVKAKKIKLMKVGEKFSKSVGDASVGEVAGESGETVGEGGEKVGESGKKVEESVKATSPKDKRGKIKGKSKERKERVVEESEKERGQEQSEIGSRGEETIVSRSDSGVGGRKRGGGTWGEGESVFVSRLPRRRSTGSSCDVDDGNSYRDRDRQ